MNTRRATLLIIALVFSITDFAFAGSATWKTNPGSGDWNTAANWSPATVPNGASDTATFAPSSVTNVSLSRGVDVNEIVFGASASAFIINVNPPVTQFQLFITGAGITNNSGVTQQFVTGNDAGGAVGEIFFRNHASAGKMTVFTNKGGVFSDARGAGGVVRFEDRSTANHANFTNQAGAVNGADGGAVFFGPGATAGNATITNEGAAVNGAGAGRVSFFIGSNGGNATIINKGGTANGAEGGSAIVSGGKAGAFTTSAANATFIALSGVNGGVGGLISIGGKTRQTGGQARVEVFGNGTLTIDLHRLPGATVGSVEGDGIVLLGANALTVGTNKISTKFSGTIKDGPNGSGGSLIKVGRKTLTLTGASTYTGGTSVKGGALFVDNQQGSATGTGPVLINNSALEGDGKISGAVTLQVSELIPFGTSASPAGNLTIRSSLTMDASDYEWTVDRSSGAAAKVTANGVTINGSNTFSIVDNNPAPIAKGTVLTAIANTSTSPIAGRFSNLPDGAMVTVRGVTYQASYEGGDGNDLILTVE